MLDYVLTKFNVDTSNKNPPYTLPISRDDLGVLFRELGYNSGVEIGVERAKFSEKLCQSNPDLMLWGVDPLIPYGDYRQHVSKEKMDSFYAEILERMKPYNYFHHRLFSRDAVQLFDKTHIDFVYIDGNHDFVNTTNDIYEWSNIVRTGGIISGHDYKNFIKEHNRSDVKHVVDAWTKAHGIDVWFITTDNSPSWFWFKS